MNSDYGLERGSRFQFDYFCQGVQDGGLMAFSGIKNRFHS